MARYFAVVVIYREAASEIWLALHESFNLSAEIFDQAPSYRQLSRRDLMYLAL